MPIYLPPISRRRFLKRALTASAVVGLLPRAFAVQKRVDPDYWALFSDIHIATDPGATARAVNMTEHFRGVTRQLLGRASPRPAGLLVLGDCAFQEGLTGDYKNLGDLLQPIREAGMPVHLALGNHDNRERFWKAFEQERAARRPIADRQAAMLRTSRANWFILDSLETTNQTPGLIGQEQLDWLSKALDANAHRPAVVFVHHNPGVKEQIPGLKDTAELLEIVRPRQQVKALFFGHTHLWDIAQDDSGIHMVNLPAVAYVFKEGQPSGWVKAHLARKGMRLELSCLDLKHPAHGQVIDLAWR
jgi:3',5'-cyclic-AMP phosphodiesterase